MKTFTADSSGTREPSQTFVGAALRSLISGVGLVLVMPLVILEPFVSFILMAIATCGLLMCLFNRFLVHDPRFPFWLMLSLSIGSAFLLLPYYALIRFLSGKRWH
jgi:hypothetical protein